MPSCHPGVMKTSPDVRTRSALARYLLRIAAARSPMIITTFVSASAIVHDEARTVAPTISIAGAWVAGLTADEPRQSKDSNGSNNGPEDASAAFVIASSQSAMCGKRGSRIWTISAAAPNAARSPPALTRPRRWFCSRRTSIARSHGEPLGDTPQINSGRRIMKANAISGEQLDSIAARRFDRAVFTIPAFAWQQPELLQRRRDGDVEYAGRLPLQLKRESRTL